MKAKEYSEALRRLLLSKILATVMVLIALVIGLACSAGHLVVNLPYNNSPEEFIAENEIVRTERIPGNNTQLLVIAKSPGDCFVEGEDSLLSFRVLPGGIIVDRNMFTFSGYEAVVLTVQIYVLVMTLLTAMTFFLRVWNELYSYSTLFSGGSLVFLVGVSVVLLLAVINAYLRPEYSSVYSLYQLLSGAGTMFIGISAPFLLLFALALTISNLVLIKREGFSIARLPGLFISFLIVLGIGGYIFLSSIFTRGSEQEMRFYITIEHIYTTLFAYLEAMLVGACVCGVIAARRKPAPDKTHVLILGCRVGSDGKPLPLLRGRIDAAIRFGKAQEEQTGKRICYVPSGGQGTDEIISEAGCMRNYLLEQGIPDAEILVEDRSATTLENMRFSLAKIRETCEVPRIAFATTNYHVLRSGIIAHSAGIDAEGIGARTSWYFWPNAFIREFIGLLVSKWKSHLLWLAFLVTVIAALNQIVPI